MDMTRPSAAIYLRRDVDQLWMECDGPYELGYVAGAADRAAGLPELGSRDLLNMAANGYFNDGYRDGYRDGSL